MYPVVSLQLPRTAAIPRGKFPHHRHSQCLLLSFPAPGGGSSSPAVFWWSFDSPSPPKSIFLGSLMTKSVTFFPSPTYVRCFSIILEIPGSGTGNIPTPHLSLGLISSGRAPPSIPKSSLFPVYGCALGGDGEGTLGSIPALSSSGDIPHTLGMSQECSQDPALCLELTLFGAGFLWDQVWLELPASVP